MSSMAYANLFEVITDNAEEASELQTRSDLMIKGGTGAKPQRRLSFLSHE